MILLEKSELPFSTCPTKNYITPPIFSVVFFFFFRKNYLLSVRPSVEIISFRGISISNWPIDLKMNMNVRKGVVHVRKA